MSPDMYNSKLLIDTEALKSNVRNIESSLPEGVKLIPVLKDDAYGLGLIDIARILQPDIDMIALSQASECIELREAGFDNALLLLGAVPVTLISAAVEYGVIVTVGRLGLIGELASAARKLGVRAEVHIKIETGLNRIGVAPGAELAALIDEIIENADAIDVTGAYSHFADAEHRAQPLTDMQIERFREGLHQLKSAGISPEMIHISNSAASEWIGAAGFNAVRVGRRLYMDDHDHPAGGITEVARWQTVVTDLRTLPAGSHLGYGAKITLDRDTVVAALGVGYGDGLCQELVRLNAPALVNGVEAKFLYTCMDQSFIDVTGIDVRLGDAVTLFGGELPSQALAKLISDEGVTLYSKLARRVARVFI